MPRLLLFLAVCLLAACHHLPPPRLVYSSGFTFANYDYVVVAKPDAGHQSAVLYGMDIDLANLLGRYNMKVVGDKELATMPASAQQRALVARFAMAADGRINTVTVSFDDERSNRTVASATAMVKGDIYNTEDRSRIFEALASVIVKALVHDKDTRALQ